MHRIGSRCTSTLEHRLWHAASSVPVDLTGPFAVHIPVVGIALIKAAAKLVPVHSVGPQDNTAVVAFVPRLRDVSMVVEEVLLVVRGVGTERVRRGGSRVPRVVTVPLFCIFNYGRFPSAVSAQHVRIIIHVPRLPLADGPQDTLPFGYAWTIWHPRWHCAGSLARGPV